jgi:two-component system heavy metal sensor histidine kinase CusS
MIPAPLTMDAAINLKKDDKLVADYRNDMIVALLFGTALSALGGYLVASRGLRPLRDIVHAIQRIRAEQLHDRLHAGRWPSELQLVASEFDRMLARLEDSFQRLRQLSADLAHELRTPVHTMLGQTEVTLSRPRDAAEYQQVLESNLEEQERLARLIDNLLFLARADNAQTALSPTSIDVGKELRAVATYFDAIAQDKPVTLVCEGDARLVADRSLFQRAVNNLVSNAIRHSPPGGKVRLSAGTGTAGTVEIRVADSGSGITPDELPRVFERFYRGNGARSSAEGAGLGLAIVRSIMTLHGGSVDLTNAPGGGIVATLHFPAATCGGAA